MPFLAAEEGVSLRVQVPYTQDGSFVFLNLKTTTSL